MSSVICCKLKACDIQEFNFHHFPANGKSKVNLPKEAWNNRVNRDKNVVGEDFKNGQESYAKYASLFTTF